MCCHICRIFVVGAGENFRCGPGEVGRVARPIVHAIQPVVLPSAGGVVVTRGDFKLSIGAVKMTLLVYREPEERKEESEGRESR